MELLEKVETLLPAQLGARAALVRRAPMAVTMGGRGLNVELEADEGVRWERVEGEEVSSRSVESSPGFGL